MVATKSSPSSSYSPVPHPQTVPTQLPLCKPHHPHAIKGEESPSAYRCGGYRKTTPGELIHEDRYEVIRKLGWGEYSTVWLVRDTKVFKHRALKIFKSNLGYWQSAKQEWMASRIIEEAAHKTRHPAKGNLVHVHDFFEIEGTVYAGETHPCLVSDLYGEHLYSLNKRLRRVGLALDVVKQISHQMLVALDFLHRECDLVHTDIKPENLLVRLDDTECIVRTNLDYGQQPLLLDEGDVIPSQPLQSVLPPGISATAAVEIEQERLKTSSSSLSPSRSPLSTLTNSSLASSTPSFIFDPVVPLCDVISGKHDCITQQLSVASLEDPNDFQVVLADLGSSLPDVVPKKSSRAGTREYRAPELFLGSLEWSSKVDIWALACTLFELATGEALFPKPYYRSKKRPPWPLEAESLMMMLEVLGEPRFPTSMARYGKEAELLLQSDGDISDADLRNSRKDLCLVDILIGHFSFKHDEAAQFSAFLLRMLRIDPVERDSARELLNDPFLNIA